MSVKIVFTTIVVGDVGVLYGVSLSKALSVEIVILDLDLLDWTMVVPSGPFLLLGASFWRRCRLDETRGGVLLNLPQQR